MKVWNKIFLWFMWILASAFMFILPVYQIYKGLVKGQEQVVKYSLITAIILFAVFVIISKYVLKLMDRKLDAVATAEELGQVPQTNFILIRILKTAEVMLPVAIITILIYGLTRVSIKIPPHIVFRDILISMTVGFVCYLIHDIFKDKFVSTAQINKAIKLDNAKQKQIEKTKRIQNKSRRRG